MRVDMFVEPCPRGRLLHGIPYAFGCDWEIVVGMTAFAGEQVSFWFRVRRAPVIAQFLQQPRTEHDIAVLPPFTLANMDQHPAAVDVGDFQTNQFLAP